MGNSNRSRESAPQTVGKWLFWTIAGAAVGASAGTGYLYDTHKAHILKYVAANHLNLHAMLTGAWIGLFLVFLALAMLIEVIIGVLAVPFGRGKDKGSQRTAGGWSVSR